MEMDLNLDYNDLSVEKETELSDSIIIKGIEIDTENLPSRFLNQVLCVFEGIECGCMSIQEFLDFLHRCCKCIMAKI